MRQYVHSYTHGTQHHSLDHSLHKVWAAMQSSPQVSFVGAYMVLWALFCPVYYLSPQCAIIHKQPYSKCKVSTAQHTLMAGKQPHWPHYPWRW